MRKALFLLIAIALALGAEAADFEHRQIGIRSQAMGGALVAGDGGVSSIYTNPAGLADAKREFFMTYSDLFGIGFTQSNFAYSGPLWGGGAGFAFEQVTNLEDLFYQVTTLQFAYGRKSSLLPLDYGFTLRRAALNSDAGTASALCFDFGVSGKKGNLKWGLGAFNAFAVASPVRKVNSAPREVKLGLAWELPGTLVTGELVNAKELNLGIERRLGQNLAVRAGLKDGAPSFGLGLHSGSWQIDYCFELGSLGSTNALGLTRQF